MRAALILVIVTALGACAATSDDDGGESGQEDGFGPSLIGSFRAAADDATTVAFSALVLHADLTYYLELCHVAVGSPECQRGHAPGHSPRLDSHYDRSGIVHMERGSYRIGRHGGQQVIYLSPPGAYDDLPLDQFYPDDADRWAFRLEQGSLWLYRDEDYLRENDPHENDVRLVRAPPICWVDGDCNTQGLGPDPFACAFEEPVGPGTCR
jgi:hypothetical protein